MHQTSTGDIFHIWQYTCFNSIFSNHPTLAFSHRVQKSVLYICVSFAVLHIGSSLPSFKIPYMCINILNWCFSFWLTSLCIIGSSFIHLIRIESIVFFFYSWVIFHCVHVPHFLIHSSTNGRLGCFHVLAILNSAEYWIGILGYMCLFQFWLPQCACPAVGLLGLMAVLFPVF